MAAELADAHVHTHQLEAQPVALGLLDAVFDHAVSARGHNLLAYDHIDVSTNLRHVVCVLDEGAQDGCQPRSIKEF